jgi:hypothetical protein
VRSMRLLAQVAVMNALLLGCSASRTTPQVVAIPTVPGRKLPVRLLEAPRADGEEPFGPATFLWITSPNDYSSAWRAFLHTDPPSIDFEKESVLLLATGTRGSLGYGIVLDSAYATEQGDLTVFVTEFGRGPRCIGQQTLSRSRAAYAIALYGRRTLSVASRFVGRVCD